MLIEVTEIDIREGASWSHHEMFQRSYRSNQDFESALKKSCQKCPVALALTRLTKKNSIVETYRLHVGGIVYRCPEVVSDWMDGFDKGWEMKPFSFELNLDDPNRGYDPTDQYPPGYKK